MAAKYPKPEPRDIVIPFLHVPSGNNDMRLARAAVMGAVTESINRETRTALQMHRNISVNPSGVCQFEGEMDIVHGTYIMNILSNLRKDANGPIDRLHVTHTMHRCDVVTIGEHWVSGGGGPFKRIHLRCESIPFLTYMKETNQTAFYINVALVITTLHTYHAYKCKVAIENNNDTFVTLVYNTASGSTAEQAMFKDNSLVTSATLYYPLQILASSMSLELNCTSNNTYDYTFNAQVHPNEDKRALL